MNDRFFFTSAINRLFFIVLTFAVLSLFGTVTNFSRDYIITKLDFRMRYDTDVEKVRKIIKKESLSDCKRGGEESSRRE